MKNRTTYCGLVNQQYVGKEITLLGWVQRRRDHGGLIFVDLRDREGIMQIVFSPIFDAATHSLAHSVRSEYVLAVTGIVVQRDANLVNPNIATGAYELQVKSLDILNKSTTLPFMLDEANEVEEETRLTYRYLDLRRPEMFQNFRLRSEFHFLFESFSVAKDF